MREYNVHEVLAILQKYHITDSPQMVARWIREGKIQGIRSENRKDGYRVSEEDLFDFIEDLRPGLPSIMEVYEEYVKKLRFDGSEEVKQIQYDSTIPEKNMFDSESEENRYESETKKLKEQIVNLENALTDLQQENQIIQMDIVELMEQINKLKDNNNALKEENAFLTDLYGILDEENMRLKRALIKPAEPEILRKIPKKVDESHKEDKNTRLSFKDFKRISKEAVSKLNVDLNQNIMDSHLENIYQSIFENESIKAEYIMEDGTLKCPYTQKNYKQPKRLISNAINDYFDKFSKQPEEPEQLELTVAND